MAKRAIAVLDDRQIDLVRLGIPKSVERHRNVSVIRDRVLFSEPRERRLDLRFALITSRGEDGTIEITSHAFESSSKLV